MCEASGAHRREGAADSLPGEGRRVSLLFYSSSLFFFVHIISTSLHSYSLLLSFPPLPRSPSLPLSLSFSSSSFFLFSLPSSSFILYSFFLLVADVFVHLVVVILLDF